MLSCPVKKLTGIDCPGCGMQRAFFLLCDGHIMQSVKMYPALIPMMLMFITLILHLIFKFKYGAKMLTILFIISSGLAFGNWILKLIGVHF